MARRILALASVALTLGLAAPSALVAEGEKVVVGRIAFERTNIALDDAFSHVQDVLENMHAPAAGEQFPAERVLWLREEVEKTPGRYLATVIRYATNETWDVLYDGEGNELSRAPVTIDVWTTSDAEIADAVEFVRSLPEFAEGISAGTLEISEAMPPITIGEDSRRLLNIVVSDPLVSPINRTMSVYEIVGVDLGRRELQRYPELAPEGATAGRGGSCGTASSAFCSTSSAAGRQTWTISWPADEPVWELTMLRPEDSTDRASQGTGLEISNVRYKGTLLFEEAHVPVFNVLYDTGCGSFRDWLFSEQCFTVNGTDVVAGIRVTDGTAPQTICQSGNDGGNFNGIGVHDEGRSLWLVTETDAGWYRYIMEWRFHLDGTLEPVFTFGDTPSGCTCNNHRHHIYWRFDIALGGTMADTASGIVRAETSPDSGKNWTEVSREAKLIRNATDPSAEWLRITNEREGLQWILAPGGKDGHATGDSYAVADLWLLADNPNQINDPNSGSAINIDPWLNSEELGSDKRLVVWYHAVQRDEPRPGIGANDCGQIGPRWTPVFRNTLTGDSMSVHSVVDR